jgi:hypothetical protein
MHSIGERADAVDHLLRAPLVYPSPASYRRYLSDLYGFACMTERASAQCEQLWRRTEHSVWLGAELAGAGCSSDELTQTRAMASRVITPLPSKRLETLAWTFVVSRMTLSVPGARRRLVTSEGAVPSEAELRTSVEDVASQLDRAVSRNRDVAMLRVAMLAALDALEDWAMVTAAATADVAVSLVRFV